MRASPLSNPLPLSRGFMGGRDEAGLIVERLRLALVPATGFRNFHRLAETTRFDTSEWGSRIHADGNASKQLATERLCCERETHRPASALPVAR